MVFANSLLARHALPGAGVQPRLPGKFENRAADPLVEVADFRSSDSKTNRKPELPLAEPTIVSSEPAVAGKGTISVEHQKKATYKPQSKQSLPKSEATNKGLDSQVEKTGSVQPGAVSRLHKKSEPENSVLAPVGDNQSSNQQTSFQVVYEKRKEHLFETGSLNPAIQQTFLRKNDPQTVLPTIKIQIGRIEVKAISPTLPTGPKCPTRPKMSLDDYLKNQ